MRTGHALDHPCNAVPDWSKIRPKSGQVGRSDVRDAAYVVNTLKWRTRVNRVDFNFKGQSSHSPPLGGCQLTSMMVERKQWEHEHTRIEPWNALAPRKAKAILTIGFALNALCEYMRWYPIVIL